MKFCWNNTKDSFEEIDKLLNWVKRNNETIERIIEQNLDPELLIRQNEKVKLEVRMRTEFSFVELNKYY